MQKTDFNDFTAQHIQGSFRRTLQTQTCDT